MYEIFGPNTNGQYTIMQFTDHYEVYGRYSSYEAAEEALPQE